MTLEDIQLSGNDKNPDYAQEYCHHNGEQMLLPIKLL